jgi:hypothetical protein
MTRLLIALLAATLVGAPLLGCEQDRHKKETKIKVDDSGSDKGITIQSNK